MTGDCSSNLSVLTLKKVGHPLDNLHSYQSSLHSDAISGQLLHIGIAYFSYASFVVQRRLALQKLRWRTWWTIGFSLAPLFEKGFYFWFLHWVFDAFCTKLCVLYLYTFAQIIIAGFTDWKEHEAVVNDWFLIRIVIWLESIRICYPFRSVNIKYVYWVV